MKKLWVAHKKVVVLFLVLAAAIALSILLLIQRNKEPESSVELQPRLGCVNDEVGSLLGKNPQIFYTSELKLLQQAYDLSIKLPEETKSLSCYYVETVFLFNTGQITESLATYGKLVELYKIENRYPDNIKNYAKSPDELKALIDSVQAELERRKQNYGGTPIEESEKANADQGL
jgi:hypothetical protein